MKIFLPIFIIVILAFGIFYFNSHYEITPKRLATQKADVAKTVTPEPTKNPNYLPETPGVYKNPNLVGLEFTYDPEKWKVDTERKEAGITLLQKWSRGALNINFEIPFGTEGYYSFLKQSEITYLDNGVVRVRPHDRYQYGFKKDLTLYSENPQTKAEDLQTCKEAKEDPNSVGMMINYYDSINCEKIRIGEIVGYLDQPMFSWAFKVKSSGPIENIYNEWTREFIEESEIEDNSIIVTVSYDGSTPEEADKIVQQFMK